MKTAVEYLYTQLQMNNEILEKGTRVHQEMEEKIFEQAKEMEKEQIVNAWENGKKSTECKAPICQRKTGIGYFNKIFNLKE